MHPFSLSAVISFMIAKLSRSKKQQQKTKSKPRKLCGKRSVPRLGGSDEPLGNLSVTPLYASELVFNARPPIKAFNLSGLFTCICFPSVCVCLSARPSRNRLIDLKCMLPPLACSALPPFPPPPCMLPTHIHQGRKVPCNCLFIPSMMFEWSQMWSEVKGRHETAFYAKLCMWYVVINMI